MAAWLVAKLIPWQLVAAVAFVLLAMVAVGLDPVTILWDLVDPLIPDGSLLSWFGLNW